jgi:acyl carrier protein
MKLTERTIILILEDVFMQKKGSIHLNTPLDDFAKDSMDIMEFIAILKNKHNISIVPSEIIILTTTKEIITYVMSHQKK